MFLRSYPDKPEFSKRSFPTPKNPHWVADTGD